MSQKPKLTLTLYPLYFKYEFDAIILITLFYASLVFGKLVVMMHEAEGTVRLLSSILSALTITVLPLKRYQSRANAYKPKSTSI